MHIHVCLLCGRESECDADCDMPDGSVSEVTCGTCQGRLDALLERTRAQRVNAPKPDSRFAGIHMHSCPKCGRGWDCSNECGVMDGSLSKAICGLCIEHTVALGMKEQKLLAAPAVIEAMSHMHSCVIGDHMWEHLDADCGFETMMEPDKMRQLECPQCLM